MTGLQNSSTNPYFWGANLCFIAYIPSYHKQLIRRYPYCLTIKTVSTEISSIHNLPAQPISHIRLMLKFAGQVLINNGRAALQTAGSSCSAARKTLLAVFITSDSEEQSTAQSAIWERVRSAVCGP